MDEKHLWLDEDSQLAPWQLDDKYNPDGDGEHPFFSVWDWTQAVAQRSTLSGYWTWLQYKIEELYEKSLRGESNG